MGGRGQGNGRPFTVKQNADPVMLRDTIYKNRPYEADPLTTMFVKARAAALEDTENLFPIPRTEDRRKTTSTTSKSWSTSIRRSTLTCTQSSLARPLKEASRRASEGLRMRQRLVL